MIIVLKNGTLKPRVQDICELLQKKYGVATHPIYGSESTIIGLVGDTSLIPVAEIEMIEEADRVLKVQEPYKRANRKFHPDNTIIGVGENRIGDRRVVVCAGPCAVESEEQILVIADAVKRHGATMLRGGAFKPRTSPYAFQGLKAEGLLYLKKARQATGLPVVSEITNPSQVDMFVDFVDVIQVGARNMQNFELLKELGQIRKPILLKRGFSNSIAELLMSAEYIMSGGNTEVILCERGIRTFETATRNTLDVSAIPVLKSLTHLPVFVDPSHAAGQAALVEPLAMAAIAAGADGLEIEVHHDPHSALSDGPQALTPPVFGALMKKLSAVAQAVGRDL
ncbi:MAG: 3-deoxy-7-phosphoheptulonate synthase [Kiritimatiellia bacterium]|jgi:3-deoxy-7-phosphoheptulonate synthase